MKKRRGIHKLRYREIFFANHGLGPYKCFFCESDVLFSDVDIHHVDHSHDNFDISNLQAAHSACHVSHHNHLKKGLRRSDEFRARQRKDRLAQVAADPEGESIRLSNIAKEAWSRPDYRGGRPKGSKDTKPRAAYGSLKKARNASE